MELHSRLFAMMRSGDVNRRDYPWFMVGTAKAVPPVPAIARRGTLAGFAVGWAVAMAAVWLWGVGSGIYSVEFAAMASVLVTAIAAAAMIRFACTQRIAPGPQSR